MPDPRLNDISLILTKAKRSGFFEDVSPSEVDYLSVEAKKLFNSDTTIEANSGNQKALAILKAQISNVTTSAPIVFVGSSSTEGANLSPAYRWINQLALTNHVTRNPVFDTLASAVAGTSQLSQPGIHFINAGIGGTTSDNYINGAMFTDIGGINPVAVVHMITANDYSAQIDPRVSKANIKARIDSLEALIARPCAHLLIHSYQRYEQGENPPSYQYKWLEYGAVQKELASEYPNLIAFIDASAYFYPIGIPSTDPLDFLEADNVHMNGAGNRYFASVIKELLPVLETKASYVKVATPRITLISDAFTGSDTAAIASRTSDAALGGTATAWESYDFAGWGINSNRLVRGTSSISFLAFGSLALKPRSVSLKVTQVPTNGEILLVVSRNTLSAATDQIRLGITQGTGGAYAYINITGAGAITLTGSPVDPGDTLRLTYDLEFIEVWKNDELQIKYPFTAQPIYPFAGIALNSSGTFIADNFVVSALQV